MRILVVEDEQDLATLMRHTLVEAGYAVSHAPTLAEAGDLVTLQPHDVVILDRRLPDGEGISLLPRLRKAPGFPRVLVLTAMSDAEDRVQGLDRGADDYLGKPFHTAELLARIRALLRRSTSGQPVICVGDLTYRPDDRCFAIRDVPLDVPRREFAVLERLILRLDRVVLREALLAAVYDLEEDVDDNALESVISRLRRRLGAAEAGVAIKAVRGVGYRLTALCETDT